MVSEPSGRTDASSDRSRESTWAETLGEQLDALRRVGLTGGDLRALAAQAKEDLGPEGARARADHGLGADDQVEHVRSDPVARVGHKAHSALGVELADRQHDPQVAFLDELPERDAIPAVLEGRRDRVPQVRLDQLVGGLRVALSRLHGQVMLLLAG
jgi:hypothetical protein